MNYLSKRLQTIQDMISKNAVVADVGSDHGKLIISLFKDGIISHGYAIENKKGPYNRLVKAIEKENLIDFIVPLLSDGITDLPNAVDTVVIAGMGGQTIIEILTSHKEKLKNVNTIIIDAHSAIKKTREEIANLGYVIAEEKIIKEENQFYEIIKFIKADIAFYSDKDLEFGPMLRQEKSTVFKEKYRSRICEINNILKKDDLPSERIRQLNEEKHRIESIL